MVLADFQVDHRLRQKSLFWGRLNYMVVQRKYKIFNFLEMTAHEKNQFRITHNPEFPRISGMSPALYKNKILIFKIMQQDCTPGILPQSC